MIEIRRQLTLFVPEEQREIIEKIRAEFNPIQYSLIFAHVTLCCEDEIEPIELLKNNIQLSKPLVINFSQVARFADGKGLMIPASADNIEFNELRKNILGGNLIRNHQPHITLMHPRNSICTDEIFERINVIELPKQFSFNEICLIEQVNGKKWKIINKFLLER